MVDSMTSKKLVKLAQVELKNNPFDIVHDERHHRTVWSNCQKIIAEEDLHDIDTKSLEISAWWHDVQRDAKDETALLKHKMRDLGLSQNNQEKIIQIVESHSYGNQQTSTEARILFDADKLEYVSAERVQILIKAYEQGKMDEKRFQYYVGKWKERILAVREQIHFSSTKIEFERRLKDIVALAEKNEKLKGFIEGVML